MPDAKRSHKSGLKTQSMTKRSAAYSSKPSSKKISTLSQSVAYNSSYSGVFAKPKLNMNPMTSIQVDIERAKENLNFARALRTKSEAENNEGSTLALLNKENIMLREELKAMNRGLTNFIEALKDFKLRKMGKAKYGNENYTVEQKLRTRDGEEKNYNQMIQNFQSEYTNLKKRLEKVGDPTY